MNSQGRNVILALYIILAQTSGLFAIPADVSLFPKKHAVVWGVQFNSILRRDVNKVEGQGQTTQGFLKTSFGVTDRFFLDSKVGMGNVRFKREDGVTLDFPAGFAGGYGFRYLLREPQAKQQFIAGLQHISCHPFKDTVTHIDHRVIWDEWQGTLVVSQQTGKLLLFAGPQYSTVQLKYKEAELRRRLKCEDVWGFCAGMLYEMSERSAVSVETRLGAETAFGLSARILF